ncbi:MAG: radical SAM protein [Desulfohalobiaceae bacterium]|nr:radical SAM protein [Desulfohalobiaceae bacterium]
MRPGYLGLSSHALRQRRDKAVEILRACRLCPRQCGMNRLEGERGFCQTQSAAPIASYHLHFGEEQPLVGGNGSGTIFFAGCNLGCVFCQNYDVSRGADAAAQADPQQLAAVMLELQDRGAHNINLVTPTHVVPQILQALPHAMEGGLTLPLVYNCGGYEEVETLALLDGIVDIYMPDLKFADPNVAERLTGARDYPEKARAALCEMQRQVGDLETDGRGVARRGVIVRHLLLPDGLAGTREWLEFLAREISPRTYLTLMDQYRPCGEAKSYPELCSSISGEELQKAREEARRLGLTRLDQRERPSLRDLLRFL